MDKREFLNFIADGNDIISFRRSYVDMTDSLIAGMMLSEIIFWHLPNRDTGKSKLRVLHDGEEWLAISKVEWYDRARITPSQARTGEAILIKLGFIKTKKFKFNGAPTSHYSLNWDVFLKTFNEFLSKGSQIEPSKIANRTVENRKSLTDLTTSLNGIPITPALNSVSRVDSLPIKLNHLTHRRCDIDISDKKEKPSFLPSTFNESTGGEFPDWIGELEYLGYPNKRKLRALLKDHGELQTRSVLTNYVDRQDGHHVPHWAAALNAAEKFFDKSGAYDYNVERLLASK